MKPYSISTCCSSAYHSEDRYGKEGGGSEEKGKGSSKQSLDVESVEFCSKLLRAFCVAEYSRKHSLTLLIKNPKADVSRGRGSSKLDYSQCSSMKHRVVIYETAPGFVKTEYPDRVHMSSFFDVQLLAVLK